MEELLVYVLLLCEGIITEPEYQEMLDERFLENPKDEMLLYLEWENNLKQAISHIRTQVDYRALDYEIFGKILMQKLGEYYKLCSDIEKFGSTMYSLWESLPGNIQGETPFHILSYADDPLSWGDEEQSKKLYEEMLDYYSHGY